MYNARNEDNRKRMPAGILWCLLLLALLGLAVGCGGEGEEEEVTGSTVSTTTVEQPAEDFEAAAGAPAVAAAASTVLDSDEVESELNAAKRALSLPLLAEDCKKVAVNTNGVDVDFGSCQYADGHITLRRLKAGSWLMTFADDFVFTGVDIDGHLLLERRALGDFDFFTADADGNQKGVAAIRLSWQGQHGTIVRDVVLTGDILATDQPFERFSVVGDGKLRRSDGSRVLDLGLGGPVGGTKDSPLAIRRPVERRCPDSGLLDTKGIFTGRLKVDLRFEVKDTVHVLAVDLGDRDIDGVLSLRFDKNESDGIGERRFVSSGSVLVPEDRILQALDGSSLAEPVKRAIRKHVTDGAVFQVPESVIDKALEVFLKALFGDGKLCP
ncbi:MAG: hypothetical protein V2A73_07880 [Pseudomonadota bacterium]